MITNPNNHARTLGCWSCGGTMKAFADDTYYTYYGCTGCDEEQMKPKDTYPGRTEEAADSEQR